MARDSTTDGTGSRRAAIGSIRTLDEARRGISPSGRPIVPLVDAAAGASGHFVALQTLRPGDAVPLHVHPVEESLTFLSGSVAVDLAGERHELEGITSVLIPAGAVHGFANVGSEELRVLVVFPMAQFAPTTFL